MVSRNLSSRAGQSTSTFCSTREEDVAEEVLEDIIHTRLVEAIGYSGTFV